MSKYGKVSVLSVFLSYNIIKLKNDGGENGKRD